MTMKYPRMAIRAAKDGLLRILTLPVATGGGLWVVVGRGAGGLEVLVEDRLEPPFVVGEPPPGAEVTLLPEDSVLEGVPLSVTKVGSAEPVPVDELPSSVAEDALVAADEDAPVAEEDAPVVEEGASVLSVGCSVDVASAVVVASVVLEPAVSVG